MSERTTFFALIKAMGTDGEELSRSFGINYQIIQDLSDYPEAEITPNWSEWLGHLVEDLARAQRALDAVSDLLQQAADQMDYWYLIFQSERNA